MKAFDQFKKELLKNKKVKEEYDRLSPRYIVASQLMSIRIKKGLTQSQLAKRIGTKQSAIARLESGNINPSLDFIEKIASGMGCKVNISLQS